MRGVRGTRASMRASASRGVSTRGGKPPFELPTRPKLIVNFRQRVLQDLGALLPGLAMYLRKALDRRQQLLLAEAQLLEARAIAAPLGLEKYMSMYSYLVVVYRDSWGLGPAGTSS